jgi:hypothetical protein
MIYGGTQQNWFSGLICWFKFFSTFCAINEFTFSLGAVKKCFLSFGTVIKLYFFSAVMKLTIWFGALKLVFFVWCC